MCKNWLKIFSGSFKKGEVITSLLLLSLGAMAVGSFLGIREMQKNGRFGVFSRADSCVYGTTVSLKDEQGRVMNISGNQVGVSLRSQFTANGKQYDNTEYFQNGMNVKTAQQLQSGFENTPVSLTLNVDPNRYEIVNNFCTEDPAGGTAYDHACGNSNGTGNNVQVRLLCGKTVNYGWTLRLKTTDPTACLFDSTAVLKDQQGRLITDSSVSVNSTFTTIVAGGREYTGSDLFTTGQIVKNGTVVQPQFQDVPVQLKLSGFQDKYDIVAPFCNESARDTSSSAGNGKKACNEWNNDTVISTLSCNKKVEYGWVVKQKPMTAQFGIFTPDGGHKCAVSTDNVAFNTKVHHQMHGNIQCTEIYHRDRDEFEVKFGILEEDRGGELGETALLFRTSRCNGVVDQCEEPILRQVRIQREDKDTFGYGGEVRCFWKNPFLPGSDTPTCNNYAIPARPTLRGTVDSVIMEKGGATYIYSRSVDGCSNVLTQGGTSCTAQGLKCTPHTSTFNGQTVYGMEVKIENENSTGLVTVGEHKGCPCNEDGFCDAAHKFIPGTTTQASTYSERALFNTCLGNEYSKISCHINGAVNCERGGPAFGTCRNLTIGGAGNKNEQLDVNRSYWIKKNYGSCNTAAIDNGTCPEGYVCSSTAPKDGNVASAEDSITVRYACGSAKQRIYFEKFNGCACNAEGQCREDIGGQYRKIFDEILGDNEDGVTCNFISGQCTKIGNGSACGGGAAPTVRPTSPPRVGGPTLPPQSPVTLEGDVYISNPQNVGIASNGITLQYTDTANNSILGTKSIPFQGPTNTNGPFHYVITSADNPNIPILSGRNYSVVAKLTTVAGQLATSATNTARPFANPTLISDLTIALSEGSQARCPAGQCRLNTENGLGQETSTCISTETYGYLCGAPVSCHAGQGRFVRVSGVDGNGNCNVNVDSCALNEACRVPDGNIHIDLYAPGNGQTFRGQGSTNINFNWEIKGQTTDKYVTNPRLGFKYKCGGGWFSLIPQTRVITNTQTSLSIPFNINTCINALTGESQDMTVEWDVSGTLNTGSIIGGDGVSSEKRTFIIEGNNPTAAPRPTAVPTAPRYCAQNNQCILDDTCVNINFGTDIPVCIGTNVCPSGLQRRIFYKNTFTNQCEAQGGGCMSAAGVTQCFDIENGYWRSINQPMNPNATVTPSPVPQAAVTACASNECRATSRDNQCHAIGPEDHVICLAIRPHDCPTGKKRVRFAKDPVNGSCREVLVGANYCVSEDTPCDIYDRGAASNVQNQITNARNADTNNDGQVGVADFIQARINFGQTLTVNGQKVKMNAQYISLILGNLGKTTK